jgi:hypothetical protein
MASPRSSSQKGAGAAEGGIQHLVDQQQYHQGNGGNDEKTQDIPPQGQLSKSVIAEIDPGRQPLAVAAAAEFPHKVAKSEC